MSTWETEDATARQHEQSTREILKLGLQPELLASMEPNQARIVISGLAKLLAAQVHPDNTGRSDSTIMHLGISDITGIEARTKSLSDEALAEILGSIDQGSVIEMARKEQTTAEENFQHILTINESLTHTLLCSGEGMNKNINASILIFNSEDAGDPVDYRDDEWYRRIRQEAAVIDIKDGLVSSAQIIPAQKGLVSGLSNDAQAYFNALRPELTGPDVTVYVPADNKYDLQPGWYCLQTAVSKSNKHKKVPAYRKYEREDTGQVVLHELVGTRLIGRFIGNQHSTDATSGALEADTLKQKAIIPRTSLKVAFKLMTKIGDNELQYMISRGVTAPIESPEDVTKTDVNLVFRRDAVQGNPGANYILAGSNAAHNK